MSKQSSKPIALAVSAALVGGLALSGSAFAMTDLASGYLLGASHAAAEGNCGADKKAEGACGGDKAKGEGKCGEGKCGIEKMDTDKDGKVSSAEFGAAHDGDTSKFAKHDANSDGFITADEVKAHKEGKCGEGKCGGEKKTDAEGDKKAEAEGKCGEGKCGGMA
ncbi:MAG TPA: EF-hand domain-containing protein [Lysobacter sp.]